MLKLTTFGESHGPCMGGVIEGVPPRINLDIEHIQTQLNMRKPGASNHVSPRKEDDRVQILSGVFEGKTLGTPIGFVIPNMDAKSSDYTAYQHVFRPGHGDYTYFKKYGIYDYRGGGRASARETVSRVVGGAIAHQILLHLYGNVHIETRIIQIGNVQDSNLFESYLLSLQKEGRSCGCILEMSATGIPAGLGEPVFDKLNADLAKALMSINAVKAIEIGLGCHFVDAESGYDEMDTDGFKTNKMGGILAGISTGEPIIARITFKPTSSTRMLRHTVTHEGDEVCIDIKGRHDPCVGIRGVPIVSAMTALVLADHGLRFRGQCGI